MMLLKYILFFSVFILVPKHELVKAPDFEFTLENGSVKKLSDYKGEVVYLSFWASWCGPCISNYKKYHEVRTKLESMGVVLLNISIDKQKENWGKSLDKNIVINGVNAHGNDLDLIQSNYQLSSIPLYEILNKKGEFVYLSEAYPRDIFADFQKWLDE